MNRLRFDCEIVDICVEQILAFCVRCTKFYAQSDKSECLQSFAARIDWKILHYVKTVASFAIECFSDRSTRKHGRRRRTGE